MLRWGLAVGIGMLAFFMFFAGAMPRAVAYCLNGPALGLAWVWQSLALPPHSEASFAMPLLFTFIQWFAIGTALGLWRCRRKPE